MPPIFIDVAEVITVATILTQLMVLSYSPSRIIVSQMAVAVG
jgi:hypothetical protein